MIRTNKRIQYVPGIFDQYFSDNNPEHWIDSFPDLMWGLGYQMDGGESFNRFRHHSTLKLIPAKNKRQERRNNLYLLEHADTQIIGNYLFSYWRYLSRGDWVVYDEYAVDYLYRIIKLLDKRLGEE